MNTVAIIAAAGQSKRMGGNINKQFIEIAGIPLLAYTLNIFQLASEIDQIIIAIENKNIELCCKEIVDKYNFTKVMKIISGGKERQDSIYNAIKIIPDETKYAIVHDGARPCITTKIISEVLDEAKKYGAAITAVPVKDTIKEVENNKIISTQNREKLVSVQTPQAFSFNIIKQAYLKAYEDNFYGTDDAMLVERLNIDVRVVFGSYYNIKITTQEDLLFAETLLKKNEY